MADDPEGARKEAAKHDDFEHGRPLFHGRV
jgi:hypothetical protein